MTSFVCRSITGLLLVAACQAVCPGVAWAQVAAPATTVIVFDGSNSMNGRLPGDQAFKHVLVREALRRALPKVPPGTRLGLAAFGHRRASDCTDAAMVVQPSADTHGLMTELERFKPRGFSPVALSLREAAAPLASAQGPASILLVLDDLASCRTEDPCNTATDLVARNPRLTISVLGLGLNPSAVERMTCVANAGKGRVANIQDAREIDAALETVFLAAAGTLTPAAPVPPRPVAATRARPVVPAAEAPLPNTRGLYLSARLSPQGPAIDRPVRWQIMRADQPEAPPVAELEQAVASFELPAGRYRVEARLGPIERSTTVEVSGTEPTVMPMVLDAGLVHVSAVLVKGGAADRSAVITAVPQEGAGGAPRASVAARVGEDGLLLPAGAWRLIAELGLARAERPVVLRAGEATEVELELEAGRLSLSADPAGPGLRYSISEDDPDSPEGRREIARSAASAPNFVLPAGAYNLLVRRGGSEVRERVAIQAGEDVRRRISTGAARVRVASRLPGAGDRTFPVSTRILRLDGAEREVARSTEVESSFELSPGRYRIEARIGGQNAVARRDIDVKAEGEQRIVLDHAAGSVQLRVGGASSGLQFGEVFWTILDGAGQPVWRTGQPEPVAVLAAGRYLVRLEARGSRYERAFEVRTGDASRVDVGG